jgi:preprotein translocase subunit SecD
MPSARRKRPWSLIIIVLVAIASLTYTIVTDNRPFLGLDLQGGVSVVLQPVKKNVSTDTLDEAIAIINQRINSFGVSEAQVSRQGNNILVEIPGVKDKDRALALVGQTAELQFRPVIYGPIPAGTKVPASTTTVKGATTTTTAKGATTSTTAKTAGTTTTTAGTTSTSQKALGTTGTTLTHAQLTAASSTTTTVKTTTTAKGATTTTAKGTTTTTGPTTVITGTPESELAKPSSKTTNVMLPEYDTKHPKVVKQYWYLGPVALTGSSLSTASSDLSQQGQWEIRPVFKSGKDGIDKFNAIAAVCYSATASTTACPLQTSAQHGQIAIVLDNKVLAAPSIDAASFQRDQITISGSFTQSEASDIATALKYGALPVVLKPATSQIVSATLGKDALHAGIVAGIVAFVLVALYMAGFYRILGGLALLKLVIEGCILWGFLCWAGPHLGLALTLAGITGIIVSIGVSLDSNVVYYEHLKEDVRAGRTIRASVDKSFASAWSTILAADFASIIGAALLYYLTVGAVRGFAFYLGLSTILDLITSYCYMRPAVAIATRSKMCQEHPHRFGLPTPDDVAEVAAASHELVATGARR